ncbi:hypothetical protein PRIPAC_81329, partial [Pristionchus pacificus]
LKMDEASSSSHQCLVCTTPINSVHLGMDICRACSSFFKRTKTTGRQYPCRTGERNCMIANEGKYTCRRCRYEKCVSLGMEYDGPLRMRRKPPSSILQRIKMESKALFERRREKELKVIRKHGGHNRIPHPIEEVYDIHQDTCYEMYGIYITEAQVFFKNVFPAFDELSVREQELIFKDYIAKMSLIEGYRRTYQIWGGFHRYVMCSVVTCHDVERNYEGIENVKNASFLVSYSKSFTKDQNDIFLPLFSRCLLTDQEHYALIALVMSELDTSDVSEEAHVILDRYRHEVLEDLQLHYQNELGLKEFSIKLGNLMTLNHAVQECKSLFKVFWRFYATMFDVFITDKLIKEFFLFSSHYCK